MSCLPFKRGHCWNARLDLAQATRPTDVSTTTVDLRDSTSCHFKPLGPSLLDRSPLSSPSRPATPSSFATNHMLNAASTVPLLASLSPTKLNFVWGSLDLSSFVKVVNKAYVEVVHWRKNSFFRSLWPKWEILRLRTHLLV